uniref:Reverse transcriptase domain-containing protein n=1 Tax=Hordeum vulgare subsp. vulgare TaxID=112509 RepID=A0A8I6XX79_HORVV
MLFLSETKLDKRRIEWWKWKLGMTSLVVKDYEGKGGGLAMFSKSTLKVNPGMKSRYHIDTEITEEDGFVWRFAGIYGEPRMEARETTWRLLRNIKHHSDKPWICVGDFNEVLTQGEKEGGITRPQVYMDRFKQALEDCQLHDLGFVGDPYTWQNNNHDAQQYIRERVYRPVATSEWCSRFLEYGVVHGDPRHSDNRPIIVHLDHESFRQRKKKRREGGNLKFEASWMTEEACSAVIENAWQRETTSRGGTVVQALKGVAGDLQHWSRTSLGVMERRIAKLKKEIEVFRQRAITQDVVNRERMLRYKLERLEGQREMYYKQRAHVNWLQKGDRNTSYFQKFASARRKKNRIKKLRKDDGGVVEEEGEKEAVIIEYFGELFTSAAGTRMEELLLHVSPRITPTMNEMLTKVYTPEEVHAALQSIGDLKAPSMDGMPAVFYKRYWETIGEKITDEVLRVLHGGEMPESWNDTCVVLIPKVSNPEKMKDLRPISLCNVIYKLVSKVIANRLKQILPEVIASNQSAFVPGRLIIDNILLAYEVTHFMQNKRSGEVGYATRKLDMSKAYDRVEWQFLKAMMDKMGFGEAWVKLIVKCCTTVQYKFRFNDTIMEKIVPGRGLRQGDPISPCLFLLCAEAFSSLLNSAEQEGSLEGVKICRNALSFNHLLFADDSLILLKATEDAILHLQNILKLDEECSGQTINVDKSAIMFSKNTKMDIRRKVLDHLGLTKETWNERYLGLSVFVGQSKTKTFAYLKDRMWQCIQGWLEKLLTKAGKEILIKACAQAIPVFAMSVFDLTKGLCEQMRTMICRFFCAQQEDDQKIHWLSAEKLTRSKQEGGLGFKDLHTFNLAMFAKHAWRLLDSPKSLCARVLKARYYPHTDILNAEAREGISYAWRNILQGVAVLKQGIIKRVGDDNTVKIWEDPWIPRNWDSRPFTPRGHTIISMTAELMDPYTATWDEQLVSSVFWAPDAKLIPTIPIREELEDCWAWHPDHRGVLSVKSAYKHCKKMHEVNAGEVGGAAEGLDDFSWTSI